MAVRSPPTPRLKSHWFNAGHGHSAEQQASAAAFIAWRLARHMLDRMRHADFDIDVGPPYFLFLREVLGFLAVLADRVAHARLPAEEREAFTVAMVRHLARILQDSEDDLLGVPPPDAPSHADSFIDLVNELSAHYGEFGPDPSVLADASWFHPGFGFVRYLGFRLELVLPDKDRRWVLDQVMEVEAPDAVAMLQRSLRDLFDPAPRAARRSAVSGD